MSDAKFPKGMFFKLPHNNAPDFVKGKMLIRREDAIEYLKSEDSEWISLDLKVSRDGKPYAQVDDWKPDSSKSSQGSEIPPVVRKGQYEDAPKQDEDTDSLPF